MESAYQNIARSSTPPHERRTRRSLDANGLPRSSPWLGIENEASPLDFFRHPKRRRVEKRVRGENGQFLPKTPLQNGSAFSKGDDGTPSGGRHLASSSSERRAPPANARRHEDTSFTGVQQNGTSPPKARPKQNPTAVALWVALKIWSAKQERLPNAESASSFLSKARSVSRLSSQVRGSFRGDSEPHAQDTPSKLLSNALEKDEDSCPQSAEFDRLMKIHADRIAPKLSTMELSTPGWADKYLDTQVRRFDIDQPVLDAAKLILHVLATLSTPKTNPKSPAVVDALTQVLEEESASSPRFMKAFATLSEDALIMYTVAIIVINIDDELPPAIEKGCVQRSIESKEVSSALINSPQSGETDAPYVGHLNSRLARYLLLEFSPAPFQLKTEPSFSQATPAPMPQKPVQQSTPTQLASEHPEPPDTDRKRSTTSPDLVRASGRVRKPTWRAVEAELTKKKPRAKRGSKLAHMTPHDEPTDKAKAAADNDSFTSLRDDVSIDEAAKVDASAATDVIDLTSFDSVPGQHEDGESTAKKQRSKGEVVTQASISGSTISYRVTSQEQAAVLQLLSLVQEAVKPDFEPAINVDVEALRQDFYLGETQHIRSLEVEPATSTTPATKPTTRNKRRTRSQYIAHEDSDINTSEDDAANTNRGYTKSILSNPHIPRPFTDSDGFVHTGQVNDHNEELVQVPPTYIWHRPEANGHNSSRIMQQPALGLKSRAQREKDEIYRFPPEIGERNLPENVELEMALFAGGGRKGTTASTSRQDRRRRIRELGERDSTSKKREYHEALDQQPGVAVTEGGKRRKRRASTASAQEPATSSSRRRSRATKQAAAHRRTMG